MRNIRLVERHRIQCGFHSAEIMAGDKFNKKDKTSSVRGKNKLNKRVNGSTVNSVAGANLCRCCGCDGPHALTRRGHPGSPTAAEVSHIEQDCIGAP